jgi:hypothetical protein
MPDEQPTLQQQSQLLDQDRIRWPGSGSAVKGKTPYGFYDNDFDFQMDCQSAAIWAAFRLGYPVVDIELLDVNFYAAYEQAVNEYGSQVNQWNIRNYIQVFQGQQVQSLGNLSGQAVVGTPMSAIVELANAYGTEVGVGGKVDWKKGSIMAYPGTQSYDLQELWAAEHENHNRISVMKVYHEMAPAFARIYDPFSMTGMSYSNVLNEMGFGSYSPAVQFLMTPIFEDLLRGQAIEFNDMVRKSAYSFRLVNNKIQLFPIPNYTFKMYFEYLVDNERYSGSVITTPSGSNYTGSYVSDYSNIPYQNIPYKTINQVGRQWIRTYFLALCKEVLGAIRQKVQSIPIPGGEITLDGAELRNEAQQEKTDLITQLRETLDAVGKKTQMEDRAREAEYLQETLKRVPLFIYVG